MLQSRLAVCLSAAALLLTAAGAQAFQSTPFGVQAIANRIDLEPQPIGPDMMIYQGQEDPLPGGSIPATSGTAAAVGPRTLSTAHASLATGILRASARATGGVGNVDLNTLQASATARMWETLSFENTNGLGVIQPFTVTVDGNITAAEEPLAKAILGVITGTTSQGAFLHAGTNTYDFFFVVPAGQTSQYFQLDIELTAYREANLDFSHTVTVEFQPVPGVTFTSASGTFLSAVPEPSAACLLLLAAPLAGRRRR